MASSKKHVKTLCFITFHTCNGYFFNSKHQLHMSFYTAVWVFSATVKELKNVGDWKIVKPDRNYLVRNWYINDTSL